MVVAPCAVHESGEEERAEPMIVWVSSPLVYGLNIEVPYFEETDNPTGVGILGSHAGP
jgi:hypothetical protein